MSRRSWGFNICLYFAYLAQNHFNHYRIKRPCCRSLLEEWSPCTCQMASMETSMYYCGPYRWNVFVLDTKLDLSSDFRETLNNEHILCRMEFCASVGFRFWPRRSSGVLHTLLMMWERPCWRGGRPGCRDCWMKSRCPSLPLSFLTSASRQGSDSGQTWRRSLSLNHTAWPQHTTWGKRFLQTTRPRLNKAPPQEYD